MTEHSIELTRRKILGSVGAIGVAGAAAGYGTSAYFSDEETFEGNQLVAGELDMKVDWEEHYSDWSDDETEGLANQVTMSEPGTPDDYTAFPPGVGAYTGSNSEPLLWVHTDDVGQFMDNTAIDAFPDSDDDGVQDDFNKDDACSVLPDVGADDDGLDPDGERTDNDDTRLSDDSAAPLVNLHDVKPGDFGEVTLSFHLCDNPGYVWLNGQPITAAEGGHTEPESTDPDESGAADESYDIEAGNTVDQILDSDVELLDEVQTAWWYDKNCDNLADGETATSSEVDLVIVMDTSGSMGGDPLDGAKSGAKTLVDAVGPGVQVGLVSFEDDGDEAIRADLDDSTSDVKTAIGNLSAGGSTAIGSGIDLGQDHLVGNVGTGARSGATKAMVVLADGGENEGTTPRDSATAAKDAGTTMYSIAYGTGADNDLMEDISSPPKVDDGTIDDDDEFAFTADQADIDQVFGDIGGQVSEGEEIFLQASLRDALDALSDGMGIPLDGDGGGDFDELNDDPTADTRGCYQPTPETNCIGFSWWLPVDHANQIQSDSVSFDVGFYTEQCRHNDGAGQAPETT